MQAAGRFRDLPDPRLASLRIQLIARRKVIAEREEVRRKRLADLQMLRAEQGATLAPGNPALQDTEQKLASVEREGAAIEALKADERQLLAEYVGQGGKEIELTPEPAASWPLELKEDDDAVSYARGRIAMELSGLQHLGAESVAAQAALAVARQEFGNRYAILAPAEVPLAPASPRAGILVLAGLLGGVLMSAFAAIALELRGAPRELAREPLLAGP
jgi:uncharacterized protein involved in exopolysaccharide biosynthesis